MPHDRFQQYTLAQGFERSGVGLHHGEHCRVRVEPAPPDQGLCFHGLCFQGLYSDELFDQGETEGIPFRLPATLDWVEPTPLSTTLHQGNQRIQTVEHLLAALGGMGITNASIYLDPPRPVLEIPLLDGSALGWAQGILEAGIIPQAVPHSPLILREPLVVQEGDAFVLGLPGTETRFTYGIDFPIAAIGTQWFSWDFNPHTFPLEIAPARTFGFRAQIEQAQAAGLIKGGSLDNALVCDETGWLNPPLRFADEPVRHKILDLIGDLSLLGSLPQGHIVAYKASHKLHGAFARQLRCTQTPTP